MAPPVIFLAFANDRQQPSRFLKALEPERTALHRELSKYQEKGWGLYHSAGSSEPRELKKDLTQHSGRLLVFHFSGHANGTQLQLEGEAGETIAFSGSNLLAFLREEPQLKLVFLNACATRQHVEELIDIGVPAVVATDAQIKDEEAQVFAESFYAAWVQGKSLQVAFEGAKAVIHPGDREQRIYRSINWTAVKTKTAGTWGLHVQEEETLQWTLKPQTSIGARLWRWMLVASVVIGIIGGIAAFTGLNLGTLFAPAAPDFYPVTVRAHDKKEKDQWVLPNRGVVHLIYGGKTESKQINNQGEAIFPQIPATFFRDGSTVKVWFEDPEGEPYRAMYPDSLYQLYPGEYLSVPVVLSGIDAIQGVVRHFVTGKPIGGARVSTQGESTISDELGYFMLEIPESKQQPFQTIRADKAGFASFEDSNVPVSRQKEIPILMKPE